MRTDASFTFSGGFWPITTRLRSAPTSPITPGEIVATAHTNVDDSVREAVAARGAETALIDAPNRGDIMSGVPLRLTWSELDTLVDGLAADLTSLGIERGDRVAIQLPNVVELVVCLLACFRLGAVAVPFPIQHRSHELRYGIDAAGVRAVITAARPDRPTQLDDVAAVVREFGGVSMATFGDQQHSDAAQLVLRPGSAFARPPASPDDVVTVCWTSGTTGTPKGVPRDHSMWIAAAAGQVGGAGLTDQDRILCPFPLVNMAGLGGMLFPWLSSQGTLVLHQPLDLPVFLGQIQNESITYTVAPPAVLNMLLRNKPLLESIDLSSIRAITSGSAPLDPWMVSGWQDLGIEVINAFGSNEGASLLSTRAMVEDPTDRARFFPRVGRDEVEWPAHTDVRTRLVDLTTGEEILEPGRQGELRFAGSTVFKGYLDSDGSEFDAEGYFRTGDVFELTGDTEPPRFYRFVDRAKDIIIRGGMNVSAAEVEALVSSHDGVAEAAVVAFPDDDLGERVGVFVVAGPCGAPDLAAVVEHLRGQGVASYKLPERLEVVDSLPRNPVGKVMKPELRARWSTP